MKTAYLLFGCWIAIFASSSGAWQGIKTRPSGTVGKYMGTLEGVRGFNCAPDQVHLHLGDSLSREAAIIALRIEVWNACERPWKDRRMYDHGNRCFHFGHKLIDTVFVGGDWTEIRVKDVPYYPYLRRTLQNSQAGQRMILPAPLDRPVAAATEPAGTFETSDDAPVKESAPPPDPEDIYFP